MTLWKVEGDLATDSGTGGPELWFYATEGPTTLPDVQKTIYSRGSRNGRDWFYIASITALGEIKEGQEKDIGEEREWAEWDRYIPRYEGR